MSKLFSLTPANLCVEIEKHEKYLSLVYAGLTKLGKYALSRREAYVRQLKTSLLEITKGDFQELDKLSDKELLESLIP